MEASGGQAGKLMKAAISRADAVSFIEKCQHEANALVSFLHRARLGSGGQSEDRGQAQLCCQLGMHACNVAEAASVTLLSWAPMPRGTVSTKAISGKWATVDGHSYTIEDSGRIDGIDPVVDEDGESSEVRVAEQGQAITRSDGWRLDVDDSTSIMLVWSKEGADRELWRRPEASLDSLSAAFMSGAKQVEDVLQAVSTPG